MASRLYAAESLIYRTVGYFEDQNQAMSPEQQKDGKAIAASIAEYAIECSINKVVGSELLDYIADEAVQLHGGYGFMAEYEVERIYRDSRINRIFEGTNEINRLLIPGTFMKKAMKGELPLLQEAQKLQEELLMMMPEEIGDEALAQEKVLVKNAKKIGLLVAGLAAQRFGLELEKEQEVLSNIADIANNVFGMESALLRTEKAIARNGADKEQQKILYTEIFCQEAFADIERDAKETLLAAVEGDNQRMMISALRKLTRSTPYNIIMKKREASVKLIDEQKYAL